ncbi:hypothetical protein INT45_011552 [Circinella minor]|uniref:Uncharacterized protein n=1 Tax=Circinella minor TaxID=1195481 RepID=A0A8H7VHJ8_9FUNG|nr:hypothetical protein INT45_011552 [Circinella minor]
MGLNNKKSKYNIELALARIERNLNEQEKQHKKELKQIRNALKEQTIIATRLANVLEQMEQGTQVGNSNQVANGPAVLIDHPKQKTYNQRKQKHEMRGQQYGRSLFIWLIKMYRTKINLPPLEEAQMNSRFDHTQEIANEVILRCKKKHNIPENSKWESTKSYRQEMYHQLERDSVPYVLLKACTKHWGAQIMLGKLWQNIQQRKNKKNEEQDDQLLITRQTEGQEPSGNNETNLSSGDLVLEEQMDDMDNFVTEMNKNNHNGTDESDSHGNTSGDDSNSHCTSADDSIFDNSSSSSKGSDNDLDDSSNSYDSCDSSDSKESSDCTSDESNSSNAEEASTSSRKKSTKDTKFKSFNRKKNKKQSSTSSRKNDNNSPARNELHGKENRVPKKPRVILKNYKGQKRKRGKDGKE